MESTVINFNVEDGHLTIRILRHGSVTKQQLETFCIKNFERNLKYTISKNKRKPKTKISLKQALDNATITSFFIHGDSKARENAPGQYKKH